MRFTPTPIAAFLALMFTPALPALSNPVGEKLIAGSATFQRNANALTVQQTTDRAIINWQGFSIGAGELTKFIQPNAASAVLNRVVSGDPSSLLGRLEANGKVFLINPNGILVGGGAVINTNAFLGSTLDVSNAKFLAGGDLNFVGDSRASILNQGAIKAMGGDVFLIAHSVTNAGTLEASQGTVGLAAGNDVLLRHAGDQRLFVQASVPGQSITTSGVTNSGLIAAVQAELHAGGGNVYALAVNNRGAIQATGIIERNGRVLLTSTGGNIENSGNIAARNASGDGGNITLTDVQQAGGTSTVSSTGVIDASGAGSAAKGGTVTLSGYRTSLDGQALVDVTGGAGGGVALIGGDYQGRPSEVSNAQFAAIGKDVRINADAVTQGDGGKVIVWADQNTTFNGQISARGGATGGDGGLIETSGKSGLSVGQGARADAGAAVGKPGTWLLDPTNFNISDGATTDTGAAFAPNADNNNINGADITAALQTGTDVEIRTASPFAGAGNVTFTSNSFNALIAPATSKATLRVVADNDITVSATIGGASANNQFAVDFKAGGNITVSKGTGFVGARNVTMTASKGSIILDAAVHAVGTGTDGNLTLNGEQGVSTANLSGSANTLIAKGLLTVNSNSGGANLQGKTEARELTGKVNANFIQSRGNANVSTSSTLIGTLKNITSEGGRVDIDNFGSLAIDGAISAAGANQNVTIRTIGDMNFLPGASITTSATGTTTLTTLANPFAATPPAGNIASTPAGAQDSPVVKGGGALVLKPLGSAGISTTNPLFTAVSQLEAAPTSGSVFIVNNGTNTGGTLTIGTNAAGRDPDAALQGVVGSSAATSTINIANAGSIEITAANNRVEAGGPVTLRAAGATSDIVVTSNLLNGVTSSKSSVTLDAGRDVNIGVFVPVSASGGVIGAAGIDLTAGNRARIIRGSSVFAQGASNINIRGSIIDVQDLGAQTLIQTQGGAINFATNAGGRVFLVSNAGGGLFTNNTAGRLGNITITADRMVLEGAINAGGATVDLSPQTGSRSISIAPNGALSPDTGKLVIPDAALDRIVAGALTIGRNSGDGTSSLSVDEAISRPLNATYSKLTLLNRGNVNVTSPIDIGTGALLLQSGIGNVAGAGNITAKTLEVSAPVGAINLGGNVVASQSLKASSSGNLFYTGNINSDDVNVSSSKGTISLIGNVKGGSLPGADITASAPEGKIIVDGADNDVRATFGVTYKDEFRLNDAANGLTIFGNINGLGANPIAAIAVTNGNLSITGAPVIAFSNGGRLELSAQGNGNPALGNINLGAVPVNVPNAGVGLVASGTIQAAGDIAAKTLDVLANTLSVDGNVTATQRLDVNTIGNMTLNRRVTSERLTLNSSAGSIDALGRVTSNLFASEAPAGNIFLGNTTNNILGIANVTFNRDFSFITSAIGLAVTGKITGGPVSSATIVASNGGISLVSGSRVSVSGNGGLLTLTATSFENFSDTNALVANNGARWLLYTPSPEVTNLGALVPDFRPVFGVTYPTVVPNVQPTSGSRAVHASADPVPVNVPVTVPGSAGGPDLTPATRVGGYGLQGILEGPPLLGRVVIPVGLIANPFQAALLNTHSEARDALVAMLKSSGRTPTDAALDATINAAARAGELGLPYQIRTAAPDARESATIALLPASGSGSLMTVVMDDGRIVNVPYGGKVLADGRGGLKVISEEGPGLVAVEMAQGKGSVIIGGPMADSTKQDPTRSINYQNSDRISIDPQIDRKVDTILGTQFLRKVTLSDGRVVKVSTRPNLLTSVVDGIETTLGNQSGLGGFVDSLEMAAMAKASGLSLADVNAMVAAGGGNLTPGVIAAMVAAGGGNMNGQRIASMVAAGGGNMVAAGGGNLLSANAVAQIFNAMVAAGGGNMVAAGGLNFAPQAVQSLVAAGGLNLTAQRVAELIGNDGSTLIGNDGSTLIGNDGSTLIGNDGSTLIGNDGSTLIGNDGSTLIGNDGSTLIGNDGSTLIGNDGSTLINRLTANLVAAGGLNLVAAGGGNLINNPGGLIGPGGAAGLVGNISAGAIGVIGNGLPGGSLGIQFK